MEILRFTGMRYLKAALLLLMIAGFFYIAFHDVDFSKAFGALEKVSLIYPAIFIVASYIQMYIRGYRWRILIDPTGKSVSLHTMFSITSIGFFLNFLPGKVGEAARGILVAQKSDKDNSAGLASVFLERLIDILVVVVIFLVSIQFVESEKLTFLIKIKSYAMLALPLIFLVFLMFWLINFEPVTRKLFMLLDKLSIVVPEKFRAKLLDFTKNFIVSLKIDLGFTGFLKLFFSSFIVWLFYVPIYWMFLHGFNVNVSLVEIIPFFAIILFFAAIPTPGMAGSLDAGVKMALVGLFPDMVTTDVAGAFAILFRIAIMFTLISAGLYGIWQQKLSFKMLTSFREKKNEMS